MDMVITKEKAPALAPQTMVCVIIFAMYVFRGFFAITD